MKSTKHVVSQKPRNDLLDVLSLVVVSGVHQDLGFRARLFREQQRPAPVCDVRMIERWFERFVFNEHSLTRSKPLVKRRQALFEPSGALPNICRPFYQPISERLKRMPW